MASLKMWSIFSKSFWFKIADFCSGLEFSDLYKQQLSHQKINTFFIYKKMKQKPREIENGIWVKKNQLRLFTFPGMIREYLKTKKN